MSEPASAIERVSARIKRHPVVVLAALVGTLLVTVSAFTDAARNLVGLFERAPDVALDGLWVTDELTNAFDGNVKYRLVLDLTDHAGDVVGNVRLERPAGVALTEQNLLQGELNATTLTFQTLGQSYLGSELITYRDYYLGEVAGDEIAFTVTSDRPWSFPVQRFTARRER